MQLSHGPSGGPKGVVILRRLARGDIALAEAFIDGDWESPDLPAQFEHAAARLSAPTVKPNVDLMLRDYRDIPGLFDRIMSIEIMDAVGEAYWPSYFSTLRDRLKPGGLAVVQAITIAEDKFDGYRRCTDFIQQNIFPGGMLPTITGVRRQTEKVGMKLHSMKTFGSNYAGILAEWRKRFHIAWPEIEAPRL